MAKYYGIGGKRRGSVGNETYAINRGENIVKSKIIQVNDAKTPEQVEQRSKLQNAVKAYQNMTSAFLKKCFEDKKQRQSTYNAFVSHNAKMAQPFFKKYSDDKNIIGIGKFQVSYGSLQNLPIVKTADIVVSEKNFKYYAIELNNEIADDANVGAVSTLLMTKYGIKAGSILNGISIYNSGVSYNANDDISTNSNSIQFYCLSEPILTPVNYYDNIEINASHFVFQTEYNQDELEYLSSIHHVLTDTTINEVI